jgi:Tfp pilus assembly protein PilV
VRSEAGFTLIEVLVSALVVILISVGVAQALMAGAHFSGAQQHRSEANAVAQQDQERLKGLSSKELSALSTPQTYGATLNNTNFTVSSQATLLSTSGTAPCVTAGTGAVAYYRTVSTVTWTDPQGSQNVTADSIITPPASGTLLTQVIDQTGTPVTGASIAATGQSTGGDSESGATDSNGCVIFTGLNPDTYGVTVTNPGFVDQNGNTTLSDTASVATGGTTRPTNNPEVIGQAGSIGASFTTVAYPSDTSTVASTVTGEAASRLAYFGLGGTQSMSGVKAVNAVSSTGDTLLTATNLFPFWFKGPPATYNGNYHVWAGSCLAEEPPSAYLTAVTVNPGGNPTATVQEPALDLNVTYAGSRVKPNHVKITFNSTDGSCSEQWNEAIRTAASTSTNGVLANPGVPFASTATSGSTASASGQTGTLSVCADYDPPGSAPLRSLTINNVTPTNFTAPTVATVAITSTSSGLAC